MTYKKLKSLLETNLFIVNETNFKLRHIVLPLLFVPIAWITLVVFFSL